MSIGETAPPNPITPTIPLDEDGARHGWLRLPYSRDDSAWGAVMIPLSVIKRGDGPTALFIGGNHGDEYEGPLALRELSAALQPEAIRGRVILVPSLNHPAVLAGRRTSPIDGGNMNRSFPGRADGSVTEKIADYVLNALVSRADLVLDFHSGGKTLDFLPFAAAHRLPDKRQEAACVAAMEAFNAPYSMVMLELDAVGMLDTEVEARGKTFVTTELGGGGGATAASVAIARKGARNLLIHIGILDETLARGPSIALDMGDERCFLISEHAGMLEPLVDLGAAVTRGEAVARIWPLERSGAPAAVYRARRGGLLAGRRWPGLTGMGDCLAVIAEPQPR
ncbi:MAG: N(2)-acetyl-L-2,4-diaminobutanoate deacetylase DoeB [Pseudomonadota bacterium]